MSRQWIALVGKQAANVDVMPLGEGGPDDLVPQACDPNGIRAWEGQYGPQCIRIRRCWIK